MFIPVVGYVLEVRDSADRVLYSHGTDEASEIGCEEPAQRAVDRVNADVLLDALFCDEIGYSSWTVESAGWKNAESGIMI